MTLCFITPCFTTPCFTTLCFITLCFITLRSVTAGACVLSRQRNAAHTGGSPAGAHVPECDCWCLSLMGDVPLNSGQAEKRCAHWRIACRCACINSNKVLPFKPQRSRSALVHCFGLFRGTAAGTWYVHSRLSQGVQEIANSHVDQQRETKGISIPCFMLDP